MGNVASAPIGWVFPPAVVLACAASFAVGANDVGNALGTSTGSRALSVRAAIVVGAVMEMLGIVSLGSVVGSTLREGIVSPSAFADPRLFVVGMLSVLCAATAWLIVATLLALPVSTTHTIVAGIFAFGLFEEGPSAINGPSVGLIGASWLLSPLFGCAVAYGLFRPLHYFILLRNQIRNDAAGVSRWSLLLFPPLAALTASFMSLLLILSLLKNGVAIPVAVLVCLPLVVLVGCWAAVNWIVLPFWLRSSSRLGPKIYRFMHWGDPPGVTPITSLEDEAKKEEEEGEEEKAGKTDDFDAENSTDMETPRDPETILVRAPEAEMKANVVEAESLFISLMVTTAALVAFAHSANDIANSVAPFLVCYEFFTTQQIVLSFRGPLWIYLVAGICLVVGLVSLGHLVMGTIGNKVTRLTPMAGFSAQFSASVVVVVATLVGIPVSTTHVIVGAVTGVGLVIAPRSVNWRSLGRIAIGWLVTIAIGAGLTLVFYAPMRMAVVTTNWTASNNTFGV